ncbi:MAG: hypothetical protein ACFFBD_00940 [Candidatus Hodarchaeota archaeon]
MSDPLIMTISIISLVIGIIISSMAVFAYLKLEKIRSTALLAISYFIISLGLIVNALGHLLFQSGDDLFLLSQQFFYVAPIFCMSFLVALILALLIGEEEAFSPKYTSIIAMVYSIPFLVVFFTQILRVGSVEIWTTEIFGGGENFFLSYELFLFLFYIPSLLGGALFITFALYKLYKPMEGSYQRTFLLTMISFDLYAFATAFLTWIAIPLLVPLLGGIITASFLYIFKWFRKDLPAEEGTEEVPPD